MAGLDPTARTAVVTGGSQGIGKAVSSGRPMSFNEVPAAALLQGSRLNRAARTHSLRMSSDPAAASPRAIASLTAESGET